MLLKVSAKDRPWAYEAIQSLLETTARELPSPPAKVLTSRRTLLALDLNLYAFFQHHCEEKPL